MRIDPAPADLRRVSRIDIATPGQLRRNKFALAIGKYRGDPVADDDAVARDPAAMAEHRCTGKGSRLGPGTSLCIEHLYDADIALIMPAGN